MNTITAEDGQTIYDIAIQEYGCYEGIVQLMKDNNISLVSNINAGNQFNIQDPVPVFNSTNVTIANFLKANKVKPNSKTYDTSDVGGYVSPGYVGAGYVS